MGPAAAWGRGVYDPIFELSGVTLIVGRPGTGKTTLALQWALWNAGRGKRVLWFSTYEDRKTFYENYRRFGWDLETHEAAGTFTFREVPFLSASGHTVADLIVEEALREAPDMVVIDSITPITRALSGEGPVMVANIIYKALREVGCDIVMMAEEEEATPLDYIVDNVVRLGLRIDRWGRYVRTMYMLKTRGRRLDRMALEFDILPGKGIAAYRHVTPERYQVDPTDRLPTGIQGLDEALGGGIVRGTSTLVVGPSGTGKTLILLKIAYEASTAGRTVLYRSHEEPREQLVAALSNVLGVGEPRFAIQHVDVEPQYYYRHMVEVAEIAEVFRPDLWIADGLGVLLREYGRRRALSLLRRSLQLMKGLGITFIGTLTSMPGTELSSIFDNIWELGLSYRGGTIRRRFRVVKARIVRADNREYEVRLAGNNLILV